MNIILTEHFIESLGKIVDFIAKDSEARADKFADDVFAAIQSATFMPKKHRKNERRRTCRASSEVFLKFRRRWCARRSLKKI